MSTNHPPLPIHRYVGLDLGQRADHSALALLELNTPPNPQRDPYSLQLIRPVRLHLRHLERFALHQPYPTIARYVHNFLRQSNLRACPLTLIVDASGPGLPFLDFFTATATPMPASLIKIMITASGAPHYSAGYDHVSRHHLLSNLATLIQNGALRIAPNLKEAPALIKELTNLQQSTRSTTAHDDLAMATALAAWQAAQAHRPHLFNQRSYQK
jgi:hypothetical protein